MFRHIALLLVGSLFFSLLFLAEAQASYFNICGGQLFRKETTKPAEQIYPLPAGYKTVNDVITAGSQRANNLDAAMDGIYTVKRVECAVGNLAAEDKESDVCHNKFQGSQPLANLKAIEFVTNSDGYEHLAKSMIKKDPKSFNSEEAAGILNYKCLLASEGSTMRNLKAHFVFTNAARFQSALYYANLETGTAREQAHLKFENKQPYISLTKRWSNEPRSEFPVPRLSECGETEIELKQNTPNSNLYKFIYKASVCAEDGSPRTKVQFTVHLEK